MTDREKFEAWYSDFSGQTLEWVASQRDGDRYRVGKYVQGYWLCYQAALASQDDVWIDWAGGNCPVNDSSVVEVKCRSGSGFEGWQAKTFCWNHIGAGLDIIAYRVVKP